MDAPPVAPVRESGSSRTEPSAAPDWRKLTAACVFGVAALLSFLVHLRVEETLVDDAFITYRYAGNLALGHGLVYNVGEVVLGTTTPAWAVILGLGGMLTGWEGIPELARLLNGALLVLAAAMAGLLVRRMSGSLVLATLTAVAYLLGPYLLYASVGGMEIPLFHVLLLGALLSWERGRWTRAALLAGTTVVVRPEGALVVGVLSLAWMLRVRRRRLDRADPVSLREGLPVLAGFMLPGALLAGATWIVYGYPVPHSVRAKQMGVYPLGFREPFRVVVENLRVDVTLGTRMSGTVFLAVLAAGGLWLVLRHPRSRPVVALTVALLVFYATSRTVVFHHYIAMMEPMVLVIWGAAFYAPARWLAGRAGGVRPALLVLAVGVFVLIRPLSLYPDTSVRQGRMSPADPTYTADLYRGVFYRTAARTLGPAIPDGTEVLLPEIGELGFYLPHVKVLDAAGLVSPETLPHLPVPSSERPNPTVAPAPSSLVRAERPDLVISLDLFIARSLLRDPWFERSYELVWRWSDPGLVWGDLRVYARADFPAADELRRLPRGVPEG